MYLAIGLGVGLVLGYLLGYAATRIDEQQRHIKKLEAERNQARDEMARVKGMH